MADALLTRDSVLRGIDANIQSDTDMLRVIVEKRNQLKDLAQTCIDLEDPDKVARFRELFKELLSMEHEVNMHTQALQTMKGTYQPANESSDFKGLLDKKIKALLQSHRFEPEAANELKDFDAGTGGGVAADDDVVEDGAGDLPYDRCPLTGKSVFDLEDPVADQKGVIYEKAVVVDYIKKKLRAGHDAVCPVAGEYPGLFLLPVLSCAYMCL